MEGIRMYISEDGYLNIPEYNIRYLIDFSESNLPSMPEAVEASVRIAGRDGDIPLMTTYEPIPFTIVCYTEDNLTPEEKNEEEFYIDSFLNSIKNTTTKFGFEKEEKFYNVKYSGLLTTVRFPKHIKFSIPVKASSPYALSFSKREVVGDSSPVNFESSTIKEVGGIVTIQGPAEEPTISLNDYQMKYEYTLLEGNKLIINCNNSTAILENSLGEKSNAMRYYNHQFPKIQTGVNKLEVQSGIDDASQVTIEWNDLKF